MTKKDDIVDRIIEAQLDIIEGADEQELREIMAANGDDYDQVGATLLARIKDLLVDTAAENQRAARALLASEPKVGRTYSRIPADAQSRKLLLDAVIASGAMVPEAIAMAYRQGRDLPDEDVVGLLEDLDDLGLLPPEGGDAA